MPAELNSVWYVSCRGTLFNQRIITNFWYTPATPSSSGADLDHADALLAQFGGQAGGANKVEDFYIELLPPTFLLERLRAQKIFPNRSAYREVVRNQPGTAPGEIKSPNTAASFTKRTALGGRKFVGRFQIPGPTTASILNGAINDSAFWITAANAFIGAAMQPLNGANTAIFVPCVPHKDSAINPPTALTSISLQTTVRTMHRRTLGLGE